MRVISFNHDVITSRRVHWPPRHLRCVSSVLIMMASLVDVCIGRLVIYGAFHHRDVLSILPTPHLNSTLTLQARCCGAPIRSSSSPPLSPTARLSSRRYKGHYLSSYNHTLHDLTLPLYPTARPCHHVKSHYRTLSLQARRGARSADVLPRGTGAAPLLLCGRAALVVTCFHVAQSDHVAILAAHLLLCRPCRCDVLPRGTVGPRGDPRGASGMDRRARCRRQLGGLALL